MSKSFDFLLTNNAAEHRWGFSDTKFVYNPDRTVTVTGNRYSISGKTMPYLVPFTEEVTQTNFSVEKRPEVLMPLPPTKLTPTALRALSRAFGKQFTIDERIRRLHSHGQTTADEVMRVLYGGTLRVYADGVLLCKTKQDVVKIFALAKKHKLCVVPYGGGTSVSCALTLPTKEERPIVVVSTALLARVVNVDKENMRVTVGAGITGSRLEEELNRANLTLGHEPDSIEFSTVGGWIATNASGMKKNRYGNIEDIVEKFTMVTPTGEIVYHEAHPRVSSGMQVQKLLFGNEGTIGIITDAVLKVFAKPEVQQYQSLIFKNFEAGVDFLRSMRDERNLPASIRLVDNLQFRFGRALRGKPDALQHFKHKIESMVLRMKKFDENKLVAATMVFEGSAPEVAAQKKTVGSIAKKHGGMFAGATNGRRGYTLTFAIAYIRDFMTDHYIIGETYETTVPWDKIHEVCKAAKDTAHAQHKANDFPGLPYISPRITQLYQTGVCIYFTHGFCYKGVKNPEEKFSKMEQKIRAAIMNAGGSISHHHGVGKLRAPFLAKTMSQQTADAMHAVKNSADPQNILGIANNIFSR